MSLPANELVRAAVIAAMFVMVFGAAELWRKFGNPPPEWTRKAVHLGGGLVSLTLPWVLHSHWTVLALGSVFAAIILLSRHAGELKSVHGVTRQSDGGLYFPISIYLLFLFGHDQPVFYLISVLVLMLSDALAALIGTTYGRAIYAVERDRRSVEGSAVFFLTTFFAVHLPLLLMTDVGRGVGVLIALQIALLVTSFEAISVRGADNLVVPLGTFLLLLKMTPKTAEFIALQIASQLAIIALLVVLVWRSRLLTASGTVAASIFFYGAWSLGGPRWILAPTVALAVFWVIFQRFGSDASRPDARYQVLAVFYTSLVASAWFVLNNIFETVLANPTFREADPFYPLYLGTIAAHLAILSLVFLDQTPWAETFRPGHWVSAVAVGLLAVVPVGLLVGERGVRPWDAVLAAGLCTLALGLYSLISRWSIWPHTQPWDARLQALCSALAAAVVLPLHLLGLLQA
ncbi:MAG TPA: hypothetical protein VFI91_07655 [Longimicrobiaceae bacterium]|nr:hypothetical protein [Longimicrobiaceae bacterium]